jgi:hypothetical protein
MKRMQQSQGGEREIAETEVVMFPSPPKFIPHRPAGEDDENEEGSSQEEEQEEQAHAYQPASSFEPPLPIAHLPVTPARRTGREYGSFTSPPTETSTNVTRLDTPGNRQGKSGRQTSLTDEQCQRLDGILDGFARQHELSGDDIKALLAGKMDAIRPALRPYRKDLWKAIYNDFPDQTPRRLFKIKVMRLRGNVSQDAPWSKDDDAQLQELVSEHGHDWKKISAITGRHRSNCRDRYRNYAICGSNRNVGRWTQEESDLLLRSIKMARSEGHVSDTQPATDNPDNPFIDWTRVSLLMDGARSRQQCMVKWEKLRRHRENPDVRAILFGNAPLDVDTVVRLARMQSGSLSSSEKVLLLNAVADYEGNSNHITWDQLRNGHFTRQFEQAALAHFWWVIRCWTGLSDACSDLKIAKDALKRIHAREAWPTVANVIRGREDEEAMVVANAAQAQLRVGRKINGDDSSDDSEDDVDDESSGDSSEASSEDTSEDTSDSE